MKFCISCKTAMPKTADVCPNCGAAATTKRTKVYFAKKPTPTTDKKAPRAIVICAFVVLIALVAGLAIYFFGNIPSTSTNENRPAIYLTEGGEMKFILPQTAQGSLITQTSDTDFTYAFSNDNRYLLYLSQDSSLFLRNVNSEKPDKLSEAEQGKLIATNVKAGSFFMTDDDKKIVYQKNTGELFYSDFQDEFLIAQNVDQTFYTAGNSLYFLTDSSFDDFSNPTNSVCHYDFSRPENGSFKLDTNVIAPLCFSDNGSSIIYTKPSKLERNVLLVNVFSYSANQTVTSIATDVVLSNANASTGELFYTKPNSTTVDLTTIVDDDKKESDLTLQDPDYDTFAANFEGNESELYDAYYQALLDYYDKVARDALREKIVSENSFVFYDLYFTDSTGKENMIADNIYNLYSTNFSTKSAIFTQVDISKMDKIPLSDITSLYNCSLDEAILANLKVVFNFVKAGSKPVQVITSAIDPEFTTEITHITESGSSGYIMARESHFDTLHTLYYFSAANPGDVKEVSRGVSRLLEAELDGKALFFTDINHAAQTATLYIADKDTRSKIIENGRLDIEIENNSTILYFANYDDIALSGKLNQYHKGQTSSIGEGVQDYFWQSPNSIYILKSPENNGELYFYNGSEMTLVDTNVVSVK